MVGGKSDAAAARWPAVLDGGGAAANVFFFVLYLPVSLLYPIINPKFTNKYLMSLDLSEKEILIFFVFF